MQNLIYVAKSNIASIVTAFGIPYYVKYVLSGMENPPLVLGIGRILIFAVSSDGSMEKYVEIGLYSHSEMSQVTCKMCILNRISQQRSLLFSGSPTMRADIEWYFRFEKILRKVFGAGTLSSAFQAHVHYFCARALVDYDQEVNYAHRAKRPKKQTKVRSLK